MRRYRRFGLNIDSEISLGEVSGDDSGDPDVVISHGEITNPPSLILPDEEYVVFRNVGAFHIRAGSSITVQLLPDAEPELVAVLLRGRMMAYLLRQRGLFPLHASAVRIGDGAVLFVAAAGTGKSTTAACFHSMGYPVFSDDVAPVRIVNGKCHTWGEPATVRLCADAAGVFRTLDPEARFSFDKHQFRLGTADLSRSLPVDGIYILEDGAELALEHLVPMDGLLCLARQCFIRLRIANPAVLKDHLAACASVAEAVPIRKLLRPRDFGLLPDLVKLVVQDVQINRGAATGPEAPQLL